MTASAKFWNRNAASYAKQAVRNEAAYQTKLEITRTYLTASSHVLEIGCGTGSTALLHAPLVKHIQAIDFSSAMIEIAKQKAADLEINNIDFQVLAIDEIKQAPVSLDMVLALSMLHLLEDKDAVIKKVFGLLKPGGVFVTSTVCLSGFWHVFKVLGPLGRALNLLPVLKTFSMQDLIASFERAGFEIDHQWRPDNSMAVFIVAKKPA